MKDVSLISAIEFNKLHRLLYLFLRQEMNITKVHLLKNILKNYVLLKSENMDDKAAHNIYIGMKTAVTVIEEIGLKQATVCAILLFKPVSENSFSLDTCRKYFDGEVEIILKGLLKIDALSDKRVGSESENYIKLLLSLAEDIRVVYILIALQLQLMRSIKLLEERRRLEVTVDSIYLYAPLAHRLGLYNIKSELEDLSLKYSDRETYDFIARKLNETKKSRDKYIKDFIDPVKEKLDKLNIKYDIKGRTKSIHSINNKLKKQKVEFENIYDLFAIRIIVDVPREKEKASCWQIYSIVTDMYQPNPKRLKDWLSIPKSNGYESLHITVMGPQSKWVEVQIRSKRMDEIAERGLAAHWKYKGLKEEATLDNWLESLRESLDNPLSNLSEKLGDFKLDLYDEEIFVFTPKGDLYKLPKGATVLDFAFSIHTKIGATCVSAKINGRNVSIKHVLKSGDQVEIHTSSHQSPKQDWLTHAVTSRARTKIRQLLKEEAGKQVDIAKEMLARRMKNRKIEIEDSQLMQLIKKLKYKTLTDFYVDIALEKLDVNWVIDKYLEVGVKETTVKELISSTSADKFIVPPHSPMKNDNDELIIDQNLTGIDYRLAKCCNPIFGDEIFGFISSQGIKIHRLNCPNAHDLFSRFGYRILRARWSGKSTGVANYTSTLRIIGNDQLNIVANLVSIISKEGGVQLRSIAIDSNDGLFQGNISVMLADTLMLEQLIKKLRSVKGVKSVERLT